MGNLKLALEDLTIAFRLNPEELRQDAITDSNFDVLRQDRRFLEMLN